MDTPEKPLPDNLPDQRPDQRADQRADQRSGPQQRPQPPGRKQKGPFVDQCAPGKYAWCRCGNSASYPYCDGTHRGTEFTPIKVQFDKPCTVVWCACGTSGNKPFCDGSHSRL